MGIEIALGLIILGIALYNENGILEKHYQLTTGALGQAVAQATTRLGVVDSEGELKQKALEELREAVRISGQ